MVFKNLFNPSEAFCLGQPTNRVFIYTRSAAKAAELGKLLELLDQAFEAAFSVEIIGNGFDASCGCRLVEGGKIASENAGERYHSACLWSFWAGRELRPEGVKMRTRLWVFRRSLIGVRQITADDQPLIAVCSFHE